MHTRKKRKPKLNWSLLSARPPVEVGDYWVAILEYPYEGASPGLQQAFVTHVNSAQVAAKKIKVADQFPDETIAWYGPLVQPAASVSVVKKMRRFQAERFVRDHRKECGNCGAQTKVNARSIAYFGEPSDCPKCFSKNSVNIFEIEKNPSPEGTVFEPPVAAAPL